MKEDIKNAVKQWMLWDKNENTKQEIQSLVDRGDEGDLERRLLSRMTFGTAGLRARMGAGNSMMNDLTLIQTAQGFSEYMLKASAETSAISGASIEKSGVVIGYDARHNSKRFASIVAKVLIAKKIKVYLFKDICATPHVPFSVLKLKTHWGIMITASHNPKEDNGFKVYHANGAQIISPHDSHIANHIEDNLKPMDSSWFNADKDDLYKNVDLCIDPANMIDLYVQEAIRPHCKHFELNSKSAPFVYTAMHGVGYRFIQQACKQFGHKLIPTVQQVQPDPEFPTVKFPNPEEGKSALKLAMETADKNSIEFILANDPDADRLAIAEKTGDTWKVFTGNEIGALFGYFLIQRFKQQQQKDTKLSDVYMISSTVSSKILQSMASVEGFNFVETLTGFKWMANEASRLQKLGKTVLFTFEEAIGFMCGTTVLDKDGISAAMLAAEMRNTFIKASGQNLTRVLEEIFKKYGRHVSNNSYFLSHDSKNTDNMFKRLRDYPAPNFNGDTKFPSMCGNYKLSSIRDLTTGYDNSKPGFVATMPIQIGSHMVTYTFSNNCIVTIRTSGTEPKIKYYAEIISKNASDTDQSLTQKLDDVVSAIVQHFFQPSVNNLLSRPT